MAPLASGNYTIRNLQTKYYLTSDGTDTLQAWVGMDNKDPGIKNVFNVVLVEEDRYKITAFQTGAHIGQYVQAGRKTWLIWVAEPQLWTIAEAGGGTYSLRLVGDTHGWKNPSDNKGYVQLTGLTLDGSTSWVFTAA